MGPILGAHPVAWPARDRDGRRRAPGCSSPTPAGSAFRSSSRPLALAPSSRFFKRYRPFIPVVERVAGLLLIVVGVLVVTNYYIVLNSWAISASPRSGC